MISLSLLVVIGLLVGGAERLRDEFCKHTLDKFNTIDATSQWFHCWLSWQP